MTRDEEVRLLEIATKLVEALLSWAATGSINSIGEAIVDLALQVETVEETHAVGELLAAMTEQDREAIAKGERWGKGSRALSADEASKALRGLTIDQMKPFAERLGYSLRQAIEWSLEWNPIPHEALVALGDAEEMAKITGGER